MESIWNDHGMDHSMDIPWSSPCGFHMDSMEFPMKLNPDSMDYSTWIPWTISHGFHGLFHMDSMEHSTWIPHGIPMDLTRILINIIK
jgi:hypothetical protein